MVQPAKHSFNPYNLPDDEQIPSKIWELLRRNKAFKDEVGRLLELDRREQEGRKKGKWHGPAWDKSCLLVRKVFERHSFAGIALQWLVPEPLFHVRIEALPRGTRWKERRFFSPRLLRVGEGTTPDLKDGTHWRWWKNNSRANAAGRLIRRGPEVHWATSRCQRLQDRVNPIEEWRLYAWPFTLARNWSQAPAEFRRQYQFLWRSRYDSRPTNPITKTRIDSPHPHETTFFQGWRLTDFRKQGQGENITVEELAKALSLDKLSRHYRVFAIPRTILTKGAANDVGTWLSNELKKGNDVFGDVLRGELLNEGDVLGKDSDWVAWLTQQTEVGTSSGRSAYFYRGCSYMDSLVKLIYPSFDIGKLLSPPDHRAHGKRYVRKCGMK